MSAELPLEPAPRDLSSLLVEVRGTDAAAQMLVHGELDTPNTDRLHQAVTDLLREQRPHSLEMDLRGVTFLDSSGIRTLLHCHDDAERQGCLFRVTGAAPGVHRVLEITGLLEHLGVTGPPRARAGGWSESSRLAG